MNKNQGPQYNKHKIEGFPPEAHCTKHSGVQISNKFPEYLQDTSSVPMSRIKQLNNLYLAKQINIDRQVRRQKIWNKLQNDSSNLKRYRDKMSQIRSKQAIQKEEQLQMSREVSQKVKCQIPSAVRLPFIEINQRIVDMLNSTINNNCVKQ